MKWTIIIVLLLLQKQVSGQSNKIENDKINKLVIEVLKNLGKRKSSNGKTPYPDFSKNNLSYIKGFVTDGGLDDLKDKKNDWIFIQDIDTNTYFPPLKIDGRKVKKELLKNHISIYKSQDQQLIFTPFIFSRDFNRVCFIFEDIYISRNGRAVSLNKIIILYQYTENNWVKIFAYPVILE